MSTIRVTKVGSQGKKAIAPFEYDISRKVTEGYRKWRQKRGIPPAGLNGRRPPTRAEEGGRWQG